MEKQRQTTLTDEHHTQYRLDVEYLQQQNKITDLTKLVMGRWMFVSCTFLVIGLNILRASSKVYF